VVVSPEAGSQQPAAFSPPIGRLAARSFFLLLLPLTLTNKAYLKSPVYLITPPFTQLNTPYPATAYLKGFLNTKNIPAYQSDLGIEVTLALFCKSGLQQLFTHIEKENRVRSANAERIWLLRDDYIDTIDEVVQFLQGKIPTLARLICTREFLPEAERFAQLEDLKWAFGRMGHQDMAKHLATLYLEDLSDLVK